VVVAPFQQLFVAQFNFWIKVLHQMIDFDQDRLSSLIRLFHLRHVQPERLRNSAVVGDDTDIEHAGRINRVGQIVGNHNSYFVVGV